ncbi:hypothetical protein GCM10007972_21270 [Iodidimonas muriae]|uniref:HTH luxR-type domain-containing protein n=1 Tax=Iodidimonas muriae TaxID=261467 RepID=A0ABQ2LGM6_9PROT|nr:helix-turn-helix transcriptional regulator [Iodidimonas muriae]GER07486.1 hypothetical protein JCM17843_17960 [Kordiimonadales bacterium JCM 17843]GGO14296.1 hypothetical protein GCM10007972_21270 [Iodidimonas muriae]
MSKKQADDSRNMHMESLIEAIGLPRFDAALLACAAALSGSHVVLGFLRLHKTVVSLVAKGGQGCEETATLAALRYGTRLWHEDACLQSGLRHLPERQTRLQIVTRDSMAHDPMGPRILDFLDAGVQISFYRRLDGGLYILRFYAADPIAPRAQKALEAMGGLMMSAMVRHGELRKRSRRAVLKQNARTMISDSLTREDRNLTPRETAVCTATLLGQSVEAISLELSITENSVRTYKKRAYKRLGISSQAQLFALCFNDATER